MTKYEAVHPMDVSENNPSSEMLNIFDKNGSESERTKITNVIPNDNILKYSATVVLMYITKY